MRGKPSDERLQRVKKQRELFGGENPRTIWKICVAHALRNDRSHHRDGAPLTVRLSVPLHGREELLTVRLRQRSATLVLGLDHDIEGWKAPQVVRAAAERALRSRPLCSKHLGQFVNASFELRGRTGEAHPNA